ncbi:MAG TPA: hypothetical protein VL461_09610 [Dictyobacter sp.]|jgi:hypothetical protein|nr:hypothetical protein [Dictyobacter sp.]
MRNQWMAVTHNNPKQYDLKLIRGTNVTNAKTVEVIQKILRRHPKMDTDSVEFENSSVAFSRILTTPFGLSKQRLLEQNSDIFGNKEIKKVIVEVGKEQNILKSVTLVIGEK